MSVTITNSSEVQDLLRDAAGYGNDQGRPRNKLIVLRMLRMLQEAAKLIKEL